GFDSTDAPTNYAETINHGRLRIGADQSIGIINAIPFEDAFGQIHEIDLVNNSDPGRHHFEAIECLRPPFEKLVAFAITLELHLHVHPKGVWRAGEINLHRMIDHKVYRHQRFDDFGI